MLLERSRDYYCCKEYESELKFESDCLIFHVQKNWAPYTTLLVQTTLGVG